MIQEIITRIEACKNVVLTEDEISQFMGEAIDGLEHGLIRKYGREWRTRESFSMIEEWLGLAKTVIPEAKRKFARRRRTDNARSANRNNDLKEDAQGREFDRRMLDIEPEEDIDYFVRGFEDENAARIRAAIASDLPPAYSTLDVRTLGKDEELEDPPEYSKAVDDGTETTLRRNSSMCDVSQNENRQALFEQKLKLFKSLDLY